MSLPCCSNIVTHLSYAYIYLCLQRLWWGRSAMILRRIRLGLFLTSRDTGIIDVYEGSRMSNTVYDNKLNTHFPQL